MFWPITGCSAIAVGLWVARPFLPPAHSYDLAALAIICVLFVWLARRDMKRGEQRGVTDYRRLRRASAHRILANDQAKPDAREVGR